MTDPDVVRRAAHVFGRSVGSDALIVRSPGRVNLIGDHIDYSGGLVLPMAIDLSTIAVVLPRTDSRIRGYSENFAGQGVVEASLADTVRRPEHGWFSYVLGVVDGAVAAGTDVRRGFDVYLHGTIPVAAGLSSSASVEMAAAVALERVTGAGHSPTDWALLAQRAESSYVGVDCGIMDQLAIALGRADHAMLIDCSTVTCDFVPVPADVTVVVADTNVQRRLADSAYNERRAGVLRALMILRDCGAPELEHLVRATPDQLAVAAPRLREEGCLELARHTVTEHRRVLAAAEALRAGDTQAFGGLMRESHESLRYDYAVTGPALDALAEAAWRTDGVLGSRMTGAGFGGCTVSLVETTAVGSAQAEIAERYTSATGVVPRVFAVRAADGAQVVSAERDVNR